MYKRKKRIFWTLHKEWKFLKIMGEHKSEFTAFKSKRDLYDKMSEHFHEEGVEISAVEIRNKIDSFSAKCRRTLTRMETDPNASNKWPLFEAARDIVETIRGIKDMSDPLNAAIRDFDIKLEITDNPLLTPLVKSKSSLELDSVSSTSERKKHRTIWTPEQELAFVCMLADRQAEFLSDEDHVEIYKEIMAHCKKLGLHVTPKIIKTKIRNLTKRYNKEKMLMEESNDRASKWMLFDKLSQIINNPFYQNLNQEENNIDALMPSQPSDDSSDSSGSITQSTDDTDNRRKNHNWKPEEELELVKKWCKCREQMDVFKRKSHIFRKIAAEFKKLGIRLTPRAVKNKIEFLSAKYKKAKQSMQLQQHVDMDWALFNALREMEEGNEYGSNDPVDSNIEAVSQRDIEKLITCGQIQFSTQHLQFLYNCQFCGEQTDSVDVFLQHLLKKHLFLNEEQMQMYEANVKNLQDSIELMNDLMVSKVNEEDGKYEDKDYQDCDVKMSPKALSDLEDNKSENQQQLNEEPLNFEVFYLNEDNAENIEQPNAMEKVTNYVMKIEGPGDLNLKLIHRSKQGYECPYCKKCFQHKYKLKVHIRNIHLGFKRYGCSICDSRFKDRGNMLIHVKRHLNIKPHLCSVCGKTFTSSTELHIHTRTHTQEKPYKCTECGMAFITSSRLAVHLRHHRNERPHGCEYCGKRFFTRKTWTNHVRTHTKERPYECSVCKATFSRQSTLKQHERLHTNIKTYQCQHCDAAFKQYAGLFGHLKRCSMKNNLEMEALSA